jgi:hypothetical protein
MSRARYIGKIALMTLSHGGTRLLRDAPFAAGWKSPEVARVALVVECVVEFHYGRGFLYSKNARCVPRDANGWGKS